MWEEKIKNRKGIVKNITINVIVKDKKIKYFKNRQMSI